MNEQIYLESIVKPLLSRPESLVLEHTTDERGSLLTITAHGDDMGRLIGKAGSTANALRSLLRQYGALVQKHISVKINDPIGGRRTPAPSYGGDKEMLES